MLNNRIAIGSVQFGIPYGVANTSSKEVSNSEISNILTYANSVGINTIDTAIAYGESERKLGDYGVSNCQVITKLPKIPKECSNVLSWVEGQLMESLSRLRLPRIYGLLLHNTKDLSAINGIVHVIDKVLGLPTVVTFTTADPNFSTLVSALTRDDLTSDFVGILSTESTTDPAPFTVFAPINEAFNGLLSELSIPSLLEIDEPTLDAVLKYHVVGGANVLASDLTDNLTITTLGGDITANSTGGPSLTDSNGRVSEIITSNIQANNGVIHAINKVILP